MNLIALLGFSNNTTSHAEKWISGITAIIGITAIWWCSDYLTDARTAILMVASMGASAVLLFAVPHGNLSQPWNLVIGHLLSGFIGVACAILIPQQGLAAGTAVGASIIAMHYARAIHPPGGATALFAVIGGQEVYQMGFSYVLNPVAINVLLLLGMGIFLNLPFQWRRYPANWFLAKRKCGQTQLQNKDIQYALEQMDTVKTISEYELSQLFQIAEKHATSDHLAVASIHLGRYYSNGKVGSEWSVRQIIDGPEDSHEDAQLVYKVVAGNLQYRTGTASRLEIAKWARYEVEPDLNRHHGWRKR